MIENVPPLPDLARASAIADSFRVQSQPLFVIGTLNTGVTVLSQQVRALNLVWGLVSSGRVPTGANDPRVRIAIVGGGFAGLTAAAGLIKKGAKADITVFERRDTVLPLQQGSDTRWVHPHIYDWPMLGSESFSAALPVLNWTASRASDVVVQVLRGWEKVIVSNAGKIEGSEGRALRVYCNTRHLQVAGITDSSGRPHIEWVGERRDPARPANPIPDVAAASGLSEDFDLVILAVGFGLEKHNQPSYWRNETYAQPQLGQATMTYIVSGAGDGAMIDLFRLRIAEFRQDRILAELFNGRTELLQRLREVDHLARQGPPVNLFKSFDELWRDSRLTADTGAVSVKLKNRLRHDTQVVLHVRSPRFADLFDHGHVSFQNRILAFLLFRAGGFHPSTDCIEKLAREYGIPQERIIERHGTGKEEALLALLNTSLHPVLKAAFGDPNALRQTDGLQWSGGYFDYVGPVQRQSAGDEERAHWRKEYLPSPTQAIATAFCSAVAGFLEVTHPPGRRLRVALHRTLRIGAEEVLQQCCEYVGTGLEDGEPGQSAGRTFPASHATIGAAYVQKQVFTTKSAAQPKALQADMDLLQLNDSSREMASSVRSIVAIPLIGEWNNADKAAEGHEAVVAVLYVDTEEEDYFTDSGRMAVLITMTQQFGNSLCQLERTAAGQIANNAFWRGPDSIKPGAARTEEASLAVPPSTLKAFEAVPVAPPKIADVQQINFDFSDFERVEN